MTRVLVIDDDRMMLQMIERILGAAAIEVTATGDARAGVQSFRAMRHDLVITDILMPEQEGVQTILELRELDPRVPILAISGGWAWEGTGLLQLVRRLGATEALAKPFTKTALLTAVENCLRVSSATRALLSATRH